MKKTGEKIVHFIFFLLGLITVGCVLLISIYLVVSGIPTIRQIGLGEFLRRYRSMMAVSKDTPLSRGIWSVTSPEVVVRLRS